MKKKFLILVINNQQTLKLCCKHEYRQMDKQINGNIGEIFRSSGIKLKYLDNNFTTKPQKENVLDYN